MSTSRSLTERFAMTLSDYDLDAFAADDVAVDGDTLVGRYTYRGHRTATFMGVPERR